MSFSLFNFKKTFGPPFYCSQTVKIDKDYYDFPNNNFISIMPS